MASPPWNGRRFRFLLADDKSVYGILSTGELHWFPHWDDPVSAPRATDGVEIGTGWADFVHVVAGGDGILYAVTEDGALLWYQDTLRDGTPETSDRWAPNSSNQIGSGWDGYACILSGGDGDLYAIMPSGELHWAKDVLRDGSNPADGSDGWDPASGNQIDNGWNGVRQVVSGGGGVIYVVTEEGDLRWYRDDARDGSNGEGGEDGWAPASGTAIGSGWQWFTHVFAGSPGQLFACWTANWGPYIRQYIDLKRDGTNGPEGEEGWRVIADLRVAQGTAPGHHDTFSCGWHVAAIEGYAWPLAADPGDTIRFHVSAMTPGDYVAEIVRLTGRGPELGEPLDADPIEFSAEFQRDNGWSSDCGWPVSFEVALPKGDDAWPPGYYAARLEPSVGAPYDVPFVVRRADTAGDIVSLVNVNTWNAYNTWGGACNYTKTVRAGDPIDLTLKRPNPHLLTAPHDHETGNHMLRSEVWLVDWLQDRDYELELFTDLDLHGGFDLSGYSALVLNTHPEYWTAEMIAAIKGYVAAGGNVLYLGGNAMFRPIELDAETPGGEIDVTRTREAERHNVELDASGRPLLAAWVEAFGSPGPGTGVTVFAGQPFVPEDFSTQLVGTTGWNGPPEGSDTPLGASGWETDHWREGTLPAGVAEIGRDLQSSEGAVIATYRTDAGGFVLGVGSITFVGSLMVDDTLQEIVSNALTDALGS